MSKALVCVVTGASRGVGRGVALAMGEAGATVYVTGRSVKEGDSALPGTDDNGHQRDDGRVQRRTDQLGLQSLA